MNQAQAYFVIRIIAIGRLWLIDCNKENPIIIKDNK